MLPGRPTSSVVSGAVLQSYKHKFVHFKISYARNTYLTAPLESETRVWNGAVVGVAILVGVLDALVNGSNASKRPEIGPVLCKVVSNYMLLCISMFTLRSD